MSPDTTQLLSDAEQAITVLLVDDQEIVAAAVRDMLKEEADMTLHYCKDPTKAIELANEIEPTVILQDLVMPEADGLTLVRFFRANEKTKEVPIMVLSSKEEAATKADSFACGANDYLVKFPDKLEVIARLRYHSRGYIAMQQRNSAYRKLAKELAEAADYVTSLLPMPEEGTPSTDWCFVPSAQLGGDSFGYHWIDDQHFSLFLLDVCGHGVGAALLSVSVMNVLTSGALAKTDLRNPAEVLAGLNEAFPMEMHNGMFFTIWYGVYDREAQSLSYASAGHPPAILVSDPSDGKAESQALATGGIIIGAMPDVEFQCATVPVAPNSKLYLYSDGTYEVTVKETGQMWEPEQWQDLLCEYVRSQDSDRGLEWIREYVGDLQGSEQFEDDFSLLEITF